ncbi:hypothetical protein CEXT_211891 [Caerostris extrusa]|uniref:Uncharacterized protein n=1 Tax=Caerostris extrusa TaxID=172846 RepID=A0AAV4T8B2_CAEEX|nr:hypothetical protein CEXT_211891 [Caerostris extrusa]
MVRPIFHPGVNTLADRRKYCFWGLHFLRRKEELYLFNFGEVMAEVKCYGQLFLWRGDRFKRATIVGHAWVKIELKSPSKPDYLSNLNDNLLAVNSICRHTHLLGGFVGMFRTSFTELDRSVSVPDAGTRSDRWIGGRGQRFF